MWCWRVKASVDQVRRAVGILVNYIRGETSYLMRNAIHVLLRDPRVADSLRRDPKLIPDFVDECLRCLSPLTMLLKRAMRPIDRYGVDIREGDRVWVLPGIANIRDHRRAQGERAKGISPSGKARATARDVTLLVLKLKQPLASCLRPSRRSSLLPELNSPNGLGWS